MHQPPVRVIRHRFPSDTEQRRVYKSPSVPARIFLPFLREVQPSIIILDTKQICSRLSFYALCDRCLGSGQFFSFSFLNPIRNECLAAASVFITVGFILMSFYIRSDVPLPSSSPLLRAPYRFPKVLKYRSRALQGVIFTEQRGKIQRGGREERTGEKKEKEERPNGSQEEKRTAREGRGGRATGERSRKRERARDR